MKNQRIPYEPPKFKDLSQFNVIGQVSPMGICTAGGSPIAVTCEAGSLPNQADACTPTGVAPTYGRCTLGGAAAEGCYNGSTVNQCVTGGTYL